jgi:Cft2 family RNA processing exonuclease
MGAARRVIEVPYRQPFEFGDVRITTYPAGHCLGSAMALIESDAGSLLYTSDYKLGESATAERCELPRADVLIMESTFGKPRYRLPPRDQTIGQLLEIVTSSIAAGRTPVVHAYQLGKSQEVTCLLTRAGVPVVQHPAIFAISQAYQQCGVELGDVRSFDKGVPPGAAVITLPQWSANFRLRGLVRPVSIAVTGWAVDAATKYRWRVRRARSSPS